MHKYSPKTRPKNLMQQSLYATYLYRFKIEIIEKTPLLKKQVTLKFISIITEPVLLTELYNRVQ
jgi:hypothetical protein